jgi:hypothetical protein
MSVALIVITALKAAGCCSTRRQMLMQDASSDNFCPSYWQYAPTVGMCIVILFASRGIEWAPLHLCALQHGRLEVCRLLLISKADVAARTRCRSFLRAHALSSHPPHPPHCSDGRTALNIAIKNRRCDIMIALFRSIAPCTVANTVAVSSV